MIVQDGGRVVGIVTDRDLAVRVLGQGLDPNATTVGDVMTTGVATLAPAQIGDGGPAATATSPARRRSIARAEATYGRLLNQLRADGLLETAEKAEIALEVVLEAIVRRLT